MREARLGHQRPDAHGGDAFLAKPRRSVRDDLVARGILVPPGIASHDLLLYGCGPLYCDMLCPYRPLYDERTANAPRRSGRASCAALPVSSAALCREPVRGIPNPGLDRKSVVWGKWVSVRVDLGGRRIIKKKIRKTTL